MSVSVTCAGAPAKQVPLDGVTTCGELRARVCTELGVDADERDVVYVGSDGKETVLEGNGLLAEVGVRGVEDTIHVRVSVRGAARSYLRDRGVDGKFPAWGKLKELFSGSGDERAAPEAADQELALQIAASGWVSGFRDGDDGGRTALHLVMMVPKPEDPTFIEQMADALTASGADPFLDNEYGSTASMMASRNGYTALVDKFYGRTALMEASEEAEVDALLAGGADVNAQDRNGMTALMFSARNGRTGVVEKLLAHGADVELTHCDGGTALMSACEGQHPALVEKLLAHGAALEVKDNYGMTALMRACNGPHTAVLELLLAHGADAEAKNNKGNTALASASEHGLAAVVAVLKRHAAK